MEFDPDDLDYENFKTAANIAKYIEKKIEAPVND